MEYTNLLVEIQNDILFVTLNRPAALNAINRSTMQELNHLFSNCAATYPSINGVILTGSGEKSFVAGADIKEILSLSGAEGMALSKFGHDTYNLIENFHLPVVAAVNGFALGGGCELAMACHIRVASEKAKFGQPEVNLGLIPGYGGSQRLIQYIGKTKALELLMTAEIISAPKALELGLVNYVVPAGMEIEKSIELIETIAKKGPLAIATVIQTVNAYFDKSVNGFEYEVSTFGKLTQSEEFVEGANAFIEKRSPNFKNK